MSEIATLQPKDLDSCGWRPDNFAVTRGEAVRYNYPIFYNLR